MSVAHFSVARCLSALRQPGICCAAHNASHSHDVFHGVVDDAYCPPVQALIGDMHGLNTLKHQPPKSPRLKVTGKTRRVSPRRCAVWLAGYGTGTHPLWTGDPALGSLILTHSLDKQVPALKESPKRIALTRRSCSGHFASWPPGHVNDPAGALCALAALQAGLYTSRPFLRFALWMGPSGLSPFSRAG